MHLQCKEVKCETVINSKILLCLILPFMMQFWLKKNRNKFYCVNALTQLLSMMLGRKARVMTTAAVRTRPCIDDSSSDNRPLKPQLTALIMNL